MKILNAIRRKIRIGQVEFSQHAADQSIIRGISMQDFRDAMERSEVIEDYPHDKYGPSCLILGFTSLQRPLHIHCSYPMRPIVKIITLYEPDTSRWIDFKVRRQDDA